MKLKILWWVVLSGCWLCHTGPMAAEEEFRIGYFEGKRFSSFIKTYKAVEVRLQELQWTEKLEFPVMDACFTSDGKPEEKEKWPEIAKELLARKDLDMIFAAGTDASRELLKAADCLPPGNPACTLSVPIVASSVTDAVKSGFVISEKDSGIENYTVRIIPERYVRMFEIFHDEVRFKQLGLLYVDEPAGRTFSNVEDAETVAADRSFDIIHARLEEPIDQKKCEDGLRYLVENGMDAFYMSVFTCFEWGKREHNAEKNLQYLTDHKIKVFARQGSRDVKAGALMGFSTIDFSSRARFVVDMMLKVLEGRKPQLLTMVDRAPPTIALNLKIAQEIGFEPSFDILGASDEIYQEIILPETSEPPKSPCDLLK